MHNTIIQTQTFATHALSWLMSFTSDFFIALILFAIVFALAYYQGRGRFIALILSLYVGYAFYMVFPFMSFIPTSSAVVTLVADIILFAVFVFISYSILNRVVMSDSFLISTFGIVILSLCITGFLLAFAYHVFPVRSVYTFTHATDAIFATKTYFFWWFTAPAIGLFFLVR
ncbi:MAG TPA: hypothetical protein ENI56_00985 [Candidatus Kaiserbacteria bacterium]|nr:hypothetical protein [Candidatus Kaiserbacteria bacterium]